MVKFKVFKSRGKVTSKKPLSRKVARNTRTLKMIKNSSRGVKDVTPLGFGIDLPFSDAVGSNVLTLLTGITTGDDDDTREGNQIHIEKIHIKGYVQKVANNSAASWARIMLVRARDTKGANVLSDQILSDDFSYDFIKDQLTLNGKGKRPLDIVWDREIVLASDDHEIFKFEKVYRAPLTEITTYSGANSAITSTLANHYFLLIMQSRVTTSDVKGYCSANVFYQP